MKLVETTFKLPITTLMIFLCFVIVGVISGTLLPLEFLPELDAPFMVITIPYPNSTPQEIEREITRPIEEVLATISNIKRMVSDSTGNSSQIFIEFKWGTNTDIKTIEAKEKIESIRNQLPIDVERVSIGKFNTSDMPVLILRISSNRDISNAYDMLNRNLKRRIERIDGVSRVTMYGIEKKEIRIQLIADRIVAHQIDINQLSQNLRNANYLVTAGRITDGTKRFSVRPMSEISSIEEVKNLIVGNNNLRLKDIAYVTFEMPELEYGRHLNQTYAIGLDVFKESGANIVEVGDHVKSEIERIRKDPKMEGINIYFMDDMADGIKSSLHELFKAGLIGATLAILVLFLFLRQWSSTLIVAMAVPLSLVVTLAFMYFLGISLNILSLLGLMLAVGMLVDNAVVVMENIHRYQKKEPEGGTATAIKAVSEVALAITAGTSTTIIVFLPMMFSEQNEITIYIKHVAITVTVAMLASLILAQTMVPLLATRIKTPRSNNKAYWIDSVIIRYRKMLTWLLGHRKASAALLILTLASMAIPVSFVKKDMFPPQEDRRLRLRYYINDTYTVAKVEESVKTVEKYLFENKDKFEIDSVYSWYEPSSAMSTILLKKGKDAKKQQEKIREEIKKNLPEIPLGTLSFERRRAGGSTEDLKVQLAGNSTDQLTRLSKEVAWSLSRLPGFKNARSEASIGRKEVHVIVDRQRAQLYGLSPEQVANTISVAMRGVNLRKMHDEDGEIDVRVEFQRDDKRNIDQLQNLKLFGSRSEPIKLSAIADLIVAHGPNAIHRENRLTSMNISIDPEGMTVNEARDKLTTFMNNYNLPPGVSWSFGRTFDFEQETTRTMLINTLLALALIYFVMASLFENLIYPAAIWTSIIFAIIGVWWFFLITGTTFSLMAWIGVLILIGVVVNNGIVLIHHINQLRERGLDRYQAIIEAGGNRIRPILMTAGTTVLSLIPLCITHVEIGGNGPPYYPMARAIVGGLIFSTFVTLIILPEIYLLMDALHTWFLRIGVKAGK